MAVAKICMHKTCKLKLDLKNGFSIDKITVRDFRMETKDEKSKQKAANFYHHTLYWRKNTEAVVWMCSVKKSFLDISQNSQESACVTVPLLIKLQSEAWNFIKKGTLAQVFSCEFCEISKNNFCYRTYLRWLLLKLTRNNFFLQYGRCSQDQHRHLRWRTYQLIQFTLQNNISTLRR